MALSLSLWTLVTSRSQVLDERLEEEEMVEQRTKAVAPVNIFLTSSQDSTSSQPANHSHNSQQGIAKNTNNNNNNHLDASDDDFMKWSIPANALFCGAVMEMFSSIAQGQALWENRVQEYYSSSDDDDYDTEITPHVRLAFGVRAFYTMIHALWLFRVRSFLSMAQLRHVCVSQALRHLVSILWMHKKQRQLRMMMMMKGDDESYSSQQQQQHADFWVELEWMIHLGLFGTFSLGVLWAGQAKRFSSVLTTGKEEDLRGRQSILRRMKLD